MNRFLKGFYLVGFFVFSFVFVQAQGPVEDISKSIGSGNVNGISRFFDNSVALTIAGSQANYSRSQAEMVLRDFFSKNSPKGFDVDRSGGGENSKYAIGTLMTANGDYRSYFSLKLKDNSYVIQEIRFEK